MGDNFAGCIIEEGEGVRCSFCGRELSDTGGLVASSNAYICKECAKSAYETLSKDKRGVSEEEKDRVIIEVKDIKGKCPIYSLGDKMVIENQELIFDESTCSSVCMHAIGCLLTGYMGIRMSQKGREWIAQCMDPGVAYDPEGGTVFFRIIKER